VLSVNLTGSNQRLLVEFGTGQQTPLTNASSATYATAQQSIYGIWDWNLLAWNNKSATDYAILPFGTVTAPTGALTTSQLQQQTYNDVSSSGVDYRTFNVQNAICWAGNTGCTTSATGQYGWYLNLDYGTSNATDVNQLPGTVSTAPVVYEQVIYNPVLVGDALLVNTTIPPATSYTTCFSATAGGYSMAINPSTGAAFPKTVFGNKTSTAYNYSGIGLSATGTSLVVSTTSNSSTTMGNSCIGNCFMVTQTVSGTPTVTGINLPSNIQGTRLTWIQKR
jgi:type IV pilus assembly protein PilY1